MTMTEVELNNIEKRNFNTTITGHSDFDRVGCLVIQNIYDVSSIIESPPNERGRILYDGDLYHFTHIAEESQVSGSLSRYNYPKYNEAHYIIKKRIENIIGKKLFTTYHYDRFYFNHQKLEKHIDRDACEISLSLHVSSNPKNIEWPFFIKTPSGNSESAVLKPGDGFLYKGCERPHWRNELNIQNKRKFFSLKKDKDDVWYHQIFFHYVLADGNRLNFAGDRG